MRPTSEPVTQHAAHAAPRPAAAGEDTRKLQQADPATAPQDALDSAPEVSCPEGCQDNTPQTAGDVWPWVVFPLLTVLTNMAHDFAQKRYAAAKARQIAAGVAAAVPQGEAAKAAAVQLAIERIKAHLREAKFIVES